MAANLFKEGFLAMSTSPLPPVEHLPAWSDSLLNCILCVLAVFVVLLILDDFKRIPSILFESLFIRNGCVRMEHSISSARDRNNCFWAMLLPVILVSDRYLFSWNFVPYTAGAIVLSLLLRRLLILIFFHPRRSDYDRRKVVENTVRTYFIMLGSLFLLSSAFFSVFRVQDAVCRNILLGESGVILILYIIQDFKNLRLSCGVFATILYLCALDLIPVAALVASSIFPGV